MDSGDTVNGETIGGLRMVPKCLCCNKIKDKMKAYVPVKKLNGTYYTFGKPGFMCVDCMKQKQKED